MDLLSNLAHIGSLNKASLNVTKLLSSEHTFSLNPSVIFRSSCVFSCLSSFRCALLSSYPAYQLTWCAISTVTLIPMLYWRLRKTKWAPEIQRQVCRSMKTVLYFDVTRSSFARFWDVSKWTILVEVWKELVKAKLTQFDCKLMNWMETLHRQIAL